MKDTYIIGCGAFLPNAPVNNDQIEQVLGAVNARSNQVMQWVLGYNGIETRHYALDPATRAPTHSNAEITKQAVLAALADARVSYDQLECLACGTSSPDQVLPHHAAMVHGLLGGHSLEAVTNSGVCCSGMAAFKYAYMNIASGLQRTAVSAGSEVASPSLRSSHFSVEMERKSAESRREPTLPFGNEFLRWMLSDGAGAMVLSDKPRSHGVSLRVDWMQLTSFAHEAPVCMYYGCAKQKDDSFVGFRWIDDPAELLTGGYLSLTQDVDTLRLYLARTLRQACMQAKERFNATTEGIDWFLPHYSSEGFRKPLHDGLVEAGFPIPEDRWFTNLKSKGNTGAASIYIMLEELMASGRVKLGQRVFLAVPESSRFSFAFVQLTAV